MKKSFALLTLVLLMPVSAYSQMPATLDSSAMKRSPDTTEKTQSYQLDNGLKIIVREDHRSPIVVSQIWYKVGSSYEPNGLTGISHLLEHMMFKGTIKHPQGEFSRIISANGGRENAFTGQDYTAYFQQLERSRLKISFELEADRMRNLQILPEEFNKERQVVMEERRMRTDDNPDALTQEQFMASAFINSGYHHPVIGWMQDIEAITADDLRHWYQRWYAPNNATLVVAGDVSGNEVLNLARKYFADIPPSPSTPKAPPIRETQQIGPRHIIIRIPAKLPFVIMGYKVPVLAEDSSSWEPYALDVLAGILDGGDSARLSRHLIRDSQVASSTSASYDINARLHSLFTLDGTPSQGHNTQALQDALLAQIKQLQTTPISPDELQRVKAQVIAEDVYGKDSVFYQAMQLGMLETVGIAWQQGDRYVQHIQDISATQVQAVARKYLIEDHMTTAVLDPLPLKKSVQRHGMSAGPMH